MVCRSCNSEKLISILDLGKQPWCNNFLNENQIKKEILYPLELFFCENCELLQLGHTVEKEIMFGDHTYLSGMTKTLKKHFYNLAKENKEQFNIQKNDLIVDIGGNDGTQLLEYKNNDLHNVLNIECAKTISKISMDNGIKTLNEYFNEELVKNKIGKNTVKLYNASGVFFHLEELHSVIKGIKYSLREDGVLIVQFMYAGSMVENLNFDTIYHEHLCYYTIRSLQNLLTPYQLEIFDAYYSEIHSGSIIAKITHKNIADSLKTSRFFDTLEKDKKYDLKSFFDFSEKIRNKKDSLKIVLKKLKKQNKKIYAYGAPAKGNTLLNYFGVNKEVIDKAVEINELKIGKYLPGSHIPVVKESIYDIPDYYLLLSHNFIDEIINNNKQLIEQGVKFIVPFPEINIIEQNK